MAAKSTAAIKRRRNATQQWKQAHPESVATYRSRYRLRRRNARKLALRKKLLASVRRLERQIIKATATWSQLR